jgi:DNA-binding GntR family transcriptional regulator
MADLTQLTYNRVCETWLKEEPETLPTETKLAEEFHVSRTTIRAVLRLLEERGLISGRGRQRHLVRKLRSSDILEFHEQIISKVDWVQERLMRKIATGAFEPNQMISELELSKQFEVTTGTVREALLKLSPLQLFCKQNRQRWKVIGLNEKMVDEMIEFRKVLELQVLRCCCLLDEDHEIWRYLQENIQQQKKESFSKIVDAEKWISLDREFHQILAAHAGNIYISEALKHIGLLMHLQQKSLKMDQKQVQLSTRDHVNLYTALRSKRAEKVEKLFLKHLNLAKIRLMTLVK